MYMPLVASPPPAFPIDRASDTPAFVQLKQALERHIQHALRPGDLFYSDSQLAESTGLSRSTVVKTIGMLVSDGFLRRSQGSGTFVSERTQPVRIAVVFKEQVLNPYTYSRDILFALVSRSSRSVAALECLNIEASSWESVRRQAYLLRQDPCHACIVIAPTLAMADDIAAIPGAAERTVLVGMADPRFCCVDVDNQGGARAAVAFAVAHGHRRIAFIGESQERLAFVGERLAGFTAGLHGGGGEAVPGLFFDTFDESRRGEVFEMWMRAHGADATCLFAASAPAAATILRYAKRSGLRLPEAMSLVVFDDVPGIGWDVTCMRQPLDAIGAEAMSAAVVRARASGGALAAAQIVLRAELCDRGSVGPPQAVVRR
jgi:DNA-binding LacI/PurR family transcriptional regulator